MNALRGVEVNPLRTTTRREEALKRAGIDPITVDKRPLSEIMNDEIPYLKWAKEMAVLVRTGHKSWVELLQERYNAKSKPAAARNRTKS